MTDQQIYKETSINNFNMTPSDPNGSLDDFIFGIMDKRLVFRFIKIEGIKKE